MSSDKYRKALSQLVFNDQVYGIEQTLYETQSFRVFELSQEMELQGRKEKYLALTSCSQLYSIDALAGPKQLLTECHGAAKVVCCS